MREAGQEMRQGRGRRGWIVLGVRWMLALIILGLASRLLPVGSLREALSSVSGLRFASAFAIYLAGITLGSVKWHAVVNSADSGVRPEASFRAYAGGLFGALFLPSVVGGDAIRLTVGFSSGARPAGVVLGNFADRLLDLSALITLVVVGTVLLPGLVAIPWDISRHRFLIIGVLAGLAIVVFLALFLVLRFYGTVRIRRFLDQLREALGALLGRPRRLVFCWLLAVSVQLIFLSVTVLLGVACGVHLPIRVWLLAWPLSKLTALVPITQGGIGIREAALVTLLAPFGAAPAEVLATGIASQAVIVTGAVAAGLCALVMRRARSERGPSGA